MYARKESASYEFYHNTALDREPMTPEEELDAFARYKDGDMDALREIIESNQRYVVHAASKFTASKLTLEDLVQEANIAMIHAATKFDTSVGIRFITYARWWIRQAMQCATTSCGYPVRLPTRSWSYCMDAVKAVNALYEKGIKNPTNEEVNELAGLTGQYAEIARVMKRNHLQLDAPVPNGDDGFSDGYGLIDFATMPDQLERVASGDDAKLANMMLQFVNDRDRPKVEMYFGMNGYRQLTMREIGKAFGVSYQAISLSVGAAIQKMQKMARFHNRLKAILAQNDLAVKEEQCV